MHKFAKQIMECVKTKVEAMGIDNIEGQHLEELEKWTEIAKNIVCYDKDYNIVEAMKEAENENNMRAIEMYEDYPERRYYDNYRYKTSGRFAPKGKGSYMPRRGYEEPPYWHMTPDMYHDWDDMTEAERMRDLDRPSMNRMYYSGSGSSGQTSGSSGMSGGNMGGNDGNRGGGNSRYENARRGYEEKKTTGADKQEKMKSLEEYMKTIAEDITQAVEGASPEERAMIKAKLNTVATKM